MSISHHAQKTLLASAARTTTQTLDAESNAKYRGLHLVIDVTSITSTPVITPKIQGQAPTGVWYDILIGSAITATGTTALKVYPGITPVANGAAADVLPSVWRVVLTASDSDSATYSVGANLLA